MDTNRNEFTNTGMELVKGCTCAVLGLPLGRSTIATKVIEGQKGRITIGPVNQPNPDELTGIQAALDAVVAADIPVFSFTIARGKAEEKYGDTMYDRFEVPSHVADLNVVYVKGLIFHATPHVCLKSTGNSNGLQRVTIMKHKYRASKKELEVYFETQFNRLVDTIENRMEKEDGNGCCFRLPLPEELAHLNEAQVRLPAGLDIGTVDNSQQSVLEEDQNYEGGEGGQVVTPWVVEAADEIDYSKLVHSFGSALITEDLISRVERVTNRRAHRYLRRGLFFSHRDLNQLLDLYEKGISFYLYTGRGPSNSALHLGHLIPFQFTQYLQEAFGVPLVVQMTDDEKFLFKREMKLDAVQTMTRENAKDIVACGFDPERTFIFTDLQYIQHMYPVILQVSKLVTFNQCRGIFGFSESTSIGCVGFPAIQAAPSFPSSFPCVLSNGANDMPCLIPCAIDQDAYFRMTRDVAPRMGMRKPALIHSKFIPGLQGPKGKMSSSNESSSIYVTDTPKQIKKKMGRAYSGGQDTKELQERFGANIDADVAYQYLSFFLEDDNELTRIGELYASGAMLSGEVKARAIEILTEVVTHHQQRRAEVTDSELQKFTSVRPLMC
eukprot:308151_1